MTKPIKVISAAEFATVYNLRPQLYGWLLGAGASAASGIPTGYDMIRDFKTRLFCRDVGYSLREVDASDPVWAQRVDDHLARTSKLPPPGDPTEYAAAFEALYPEETHRRQYIDDALKKGTPCFAHRVLASLMVSGSVSCVFTTNFDPLIEDAAVEAASCLPKADAARPTIAALDSAARATRCLDESDWPLVAKLHGDYRSVDLKNTDGELESQDAHMRRVLVEACKRFGLTVVGYSGRDASVMEALESVLSYEKPFPSGLYWTISSRAKLLPSVEAFLQKAAERDVDVFVIESKTFDELAADLLAQSSLPEVLQRHVLKHRPESRLQPVKLQDSDARNFPVLRYSSLLVETLPAFARRIRLREASTTANVREILMKAGCRAVASVQGKEVAVFGRDDEILKALSSLGATANGTIPLDPALDSWALGLLYDALLKALSRRRPLIPRLRRSGHALFVARPNEGELDERRLQRVAQLAKLQSAYGEPLTGNALGRDFNEAISLRLERVEDRWWCGFDPFTLVHIPPEERPARSDVLAGEEDGLGWGVASRPIDPTAEWRRQRWAQKFNAAWASIIDAWADLLTSPKGQSFRAFGVEEGAGIDAAFTISPVTGWSRPSHHHAYFERKR